MKIDKFTCIRCPMGCALEVRTDGGKITVTGNACKRGEQYALDEATAPKRTVTSTAELIGGELARAPVKTADAVPKEKMFEVLEEIKNARLTAPVRIGDIAVKNAAGTGVDVVVTRNIDRKIVFADGDGQDTERRIRQ